MTLISAITTCKGRLAHLQLTLPTLMAADMEVVVVDYDCPDRAGAWVRGTFPRARVVEVSDRPYFNISAARNLGAAAATAEWLVFVDADVSLTPAFVPAVEGLIQPDTFLLAEPRGGLWGALVVQRRHFQAIGGYDEVFEGWGDEDAEIVIRLAMYGLRQSTFPQALLTPLRHEDAIRTRFHEIDDLALNAAINGFYRTVKIDLARQGHWLDLDARRRLYAAIRGGMLSAEGLTFLQVPVRTSRVHGYDVRCSLRYDFTLNVATGERAARTFAPRDGNLA